MRYISIFSGIEAASCAWQILGFEPVSNTQRYKMLGNSMAVPVMRWIGARILLVERSNNAN